MGFAYACPCEHREGRCVSSMRLVVLGIPFVFSISREKVMNIYSLFDQKLKEFGPLLVMNNDEGMKRAVRDGIPGSGGTIEKYPEDYSLHRLGTYDADTGIIVPEEVPMFVELVSVILPPKVVADATR